MHSFLPFSFIFSIVITVCDFTDSFPTLILLLKGKQEPNESNLYLVAHSGLHETKLQPT